MIAAACHDFETAGLPNVEKAAPAQPTPRGSPNALAGAGSPGMGTSQVPALDHAAAADAVVDHASEEHRPEQLMEARFAGMDQLLAAEKVSESVAICANRDTKRRLRHPLMGASQDGGALQPSASSQTGSGFTRDASQPPAAPCPPTSEDGCPL